ncbi:DUF885 domain-containing protein [Enterovirga sp. GCM10030262]|uniref:DUF885 domain-containing protein n=1 Tax=Enterovirga sp. GCM10030262 TaxID=3273391 RepID=UPI003617B595
MTKNLLPLATLLLAGLSPIALAAPATAQTASATAEAAGADARLRALYDAEWAWRMNEYHRVKQDEDWVAGDRLPDVDAAAQSRRLAYLEKTLAQLQAIPVDQLSPEERINAAVFRTNLEHDISDARFREWEMPFDSDSSFWTYLNPRQGYRTAEEYRRYLNRMRDIPRYFDQHIVNMRAGLERGFSVPRVTLTGRDSSIVPFTDADSARNPFYDAFEMMPDGIPAAEQAALRAEAETVIRDAVAPAYAELLTFIREDYLPNTRTTIAAADMPEGEAYYLANIRQYSTLDLTPQQIHEIGLKEVARIQADMRATIAETGFKGDFKEFLTFLKTDPRFYAKTPEELLSFSAYVAKRVDGKIGDTIGLLPRGRFTILPVPDAIAPFYTAGRGGLESCLMNTHNLPARPLYNIPALTLHECAPGHSFQAALALEAPERPDFRGETYFSGYGEGWGLYTEWLGIGMGIYRTPYEEFGRQSYEMWRAVRLVIDPGIHAMGWSRDKAIAYLADHTALSQHEVETEVDRYISWPGQAVAYKLGEMTIRRLRAKAEKALGADFDQRWFHDTILALGSVPLPVLEQEIDRFIAAGGKKPADSPA